MRTTSDLVNIRVDRLYPHPENPRKDVGDVSELAESVKKIGIMQNLTVIPISALEKEEDEQPGAGEISLSSDFIVLIGHRRMAAARAAGIAEVPCKIISNISKKEQIAIMLEENMQRADLTILEQAQGFQLMLDLGETEDSIAEKTGFSKRTVKRRLNIAKLDQEELKKRQDDEGFQLSLKDLYELEKVESLEKRNEILRNARDSRDVAWRAQNAAREEDRKKKYIIIEAMLKKEGFKKAPKGAENEQYSDKWETVVEYDLEKDVPEKVRKYQEGMFYLEYVRKLRIIRKKVKEKAEKTPEQIEKARIDKTKKEIKAKMKELHVQCREFVVSVAEGKLPDVKEPGLLEQMWNVLKQQGYISLSSAKKQFDGKNDWERKPEEKEVINEKFDKLPITQQMLFAVSGVIVGVEEPFDYQLRYKIDTGKMLLDAFEILEKYGWSFQDEDIERIVDGTSDMYERSEK